jgi:hypothetical protein
MQRTNYDMWKEKSMNKKSRRNHEINSESSASRDQIQQETGIRRQRNKMQQLETTNKT